MKKKLLLLFAVLLTAVKASAYDFMVNRIFYNVISNSDLTCEVTHYGGVNHEGKPNGASYSREVVIPSTVTYKGRKYTVTSIGNDAFYNCAALKSVKIPNSVTSIGDWAFHNCISLTSVVIPNSVTSIGEYSFYFCNKLTSVDFGNAVTSIGEGAFFSCWSLTSVVIPNSVTSIGESAFWGCNALTSVVIPNSVTMIGKSAFCNCFGLESFYGKFASDDHRCLIVDGELNSFAPAGLTSYTIPNSITKIGESAFVLCSSLTSVEIPNSVTEIGKEAFAECTSLTSVNISNLTAWCKIDFKDWGANPLFYAHNLYLKGELVTNLVIPKTITAIKQHAFSQCSSLTSVVIPNTVTKIELLAFDTCNNLTSVEIPNSVTVIGNSAFSDCSSLKSVKIGNSVHTIDWHAFFNCSSLKEITSLNMSPPDASEYYLSNVFGDFNKSNCILKVPASSVYKYKYATLWKEFKNIVGI